MQPWKNIHKMLQNEKQQQQNQNRLINTEKPFLIYICMICNYIFTYSTRQSIYLNTVAFGGILLTALIAFLILNTNMNI